MLEEIWLMPFLSQHLASLLHKAIAQVRVLENRHFRRLVARSPQAPQLSRAACFFFLYHRISPLISALKSCPGQPVPTWLLTFCFLSRQEVWEHLPGAQLSSST